MQVAPRAAPVPGVGVGLQRKQRGTSGGRLASPVSTAERGGPLFTGDPGHTLSSLWEGRGGAGLGGWVF